LKCFGDTLLGNALAHLFFSKTLAVILIANLFILSFCNALSTPVWYLFLLYPASICAAYWLISKTWVKRTRLAVSWGMISWIAVFWLLITLLRIPYVLEWIPDNIVVVQWDDMQRLSGLISMTMSDDFPLKHFANQKYLYSYYYASMIPLAYLKLVLPFITLKDTLFIGNSAYYILILVSLLEVVNILSPKRETLWTMTFLFTAFGGFDWVVDTVISGNRLISHHEWWQRMNILHGDAQISSFFTVLFWAIPHVLGFYACLLAYIFLSKVRFTHKVTKSLVIGLLLISGFYCSVFSILSVPLYCIVEYKILVKRFLNVRVLPVLLVILLLPIQLFLNKPSSIGFIPASFRIDFTGSFILDKLFSLPIWFVIVTLVELSLIPVLLVMVFDEITSKEKKYFIAAMTFYVSTYFISFTNFNNYSNRGMLLPTFIFYFLFSKYVLSFQFIRDILFSPFKRVTILIPLLALFFIGTIIEYSAQGIRSISCMSVSCNYIGLNPCYQSSIDYRKLARDKSSKYLVRPSYDNSMDIYNAEKMVLDTPLEKMYYAELEQLRFK
jgi:hypothetical protein